MAPAQRVEGPASGAVRTITPTDIAQFIRLEQCRRYLRLRLREHAEGRRFIYDYGVQPQAIPTLLTKSGAAFEAMVEAAVAQRYWKINFVGDMAHAGRREHDNERVIEIARGLVPGEVAVLFQPRLLVELAGWRIRGDVDLLRLERDADGALNILIADMKATTRTKVEHRLQVAFYVELLGALFAEAEIDHTEIRMGILYRGPVQSDSAPPQSPVTGPATCAEIPSVGTSCAGPQRPDGEYLGTRDNLENKRGSQSNIRGSAQETPTEASTRDGGVTSGDDLHDEQRDLAEAMFATREALLELVPDPDSYRASVRDLVTAVDSVAANVADGDLAELPFHLGYKCGGCLYNEFCLKWTAEHDDLSLLPHITPEEKGALQRAGITTTTQLAHLKLFHHEVEPTTHTQHTQGMRNTHTPGRSRASVPARPGPSRENARPTGNEGGPAQRRIYSDKFLRGVARSCLGPQFRSA